MDEIKAIAITGIGCRFPGGANGPDAFWKLLRDGVDAIGEVPPDRWNTDTYYDAKPGRRARSITRWGGFVDEIDVFDAGFFGISPREAAFVDPQQRLLLRAAWEALEDAGETLDKIQASPTGVFIGISTNDYAWLQSTPTDNSGIDVWTATGGVASIAANRISYCLDLRGPSISVDTACSSSLVAVHLACRSLLGGECAVALAGGVNALLLPSPFISFSRGGMLSPDGRCKAFDARANGFVRAEGVGVVVLKPLSAAVACGDPIYAVILGTAVNQDGRTSGITVPNTVAQVALVRETCRVAGVSPRDVKYVEAHGTGTAVGDPIETEAIGTALGSDGARTSPCVIGSVKTNIGHLEAGAGIAGLIKVALSLHHGAIPPNLHFQKPNPRIDFERLGLRVPQRMEAFPLGDGPILAGVNSFGFGGTNAHAILGSVSRPHPSDTTPGSDRARLLTLSARSAESLRGLAKKYVGFLSPDGGASLEDVCFSAGARRTHHGQRLAVVGVGRDGLIERLGAFLAGEERSGLSAGEAVTEPGPVFVFSGQGPQWWAMGRELLAEEPVFRQKIQECDKILRGLGRWSLMEELSRDESRSRLQQTDIAQPAIFALQVGLAALWQQWGIRPAATVGHSVGEVAAAHVAGALTLAEAARVIYHRGRCMEMASERGRMLATGLTWTKALECVAPYADRVSAAALNGPSSVVLSGDGEALGEIAAKLESAGVFCRFLQVNYAFHSQQMDPIRDRLLRALGRVKVRPTDVCLMSTVSGTAAAGSDFDGEYWWRNVRQPVLFATAIEALLKRGHRTFLELSAHPVLAGPVAECVSGAGLRGGVLPSLRRKEPERATMLGSLGALYVRGAHVDFSGLYPSGEAVRLPTYAWQLERYWSEAEEWRTARLGSAAHPLLARSLETGSPTWRTSLDLEEFHYLKDHRIQGHVVFPAAAYVEMALGAGKSILDSGSIILEEVDFQRALFLAEGEDPATIEFCCDTRDGGFKIAAANRNGDKIEWATHAAGRLRAETGTAKPSVAGPDEVVGRCGAEISSESIYRAYADAGFGFGPSFHGIETARMGKGEAIARVRLTPEIQADADRYQVHPAMLDACFQVLSLAIPAKGSRLRFSLYLPVQVSRVRFFGKPGGAVWCHAMLVQHGSRSLAGDIRIFDEKGRILIEVEGLRCQATTQTGVGNDGNVYALRWKPRPLGRRATGADFIAPVTEVLGRANAVMGRRSDRRRDETEARELETGIDGLCREYFLNALGTLGCRLDEGVSFDAGDLLQKVGASGGRWPALSCFVDLLVRDGILRHVGGRMTACKKIGHPNPEALANRILARFPGALPEVTLARTCGLDLSALLGGAMAPPHWLSAEGPLPMVEYFYQDSCTCRDWNRGIAEALVTAIGRRSEGRVVRILEIGAGTGGTTAHILPRLPRDRVEYVFTDLLEEAFPAAEQKFFDFPFVRYQKLDIAKDPGEQGFEAGAHDVIVVANVLHGAGDVGGALKHIRSLLAPGGLLLLQEFLRPSWLGDQALGFAENWWREGDGALGQGLDCTGWQALLREQGYAEVAATTGPESDGGPRQVLLAARSPMVTASQDGEPSVSPTKQAPGTWLIFADRCGVERGVADVLALRGDTVVTVHAGLKFTRTAPAQFEARPDSAEDMRLLIKEVLAGGGPRLSGIAHFWSLDAPRAGELDCEGLIGAEAIGCHSMVRLLQALGQEATSEKPRLWLITRGAQAVTTGDPVDVAQAPLWGLGRVIVNELPRFQCRMIDLAAGPSRDEAMAVVAEFGAEDCEDEVALRGDDRYVQRLGPTALERQLSSDRSGESVGFQLRSAAPGALDRLSFCARARRTPGPGEVEVAIKAAALNFRDVMKALGIYPTEGDEDLLLGDECSGRITAVGAGVRDWAVGDDVLAVASGCFSSHITIAAERLARIPAGLEFEEAAAIPVAFLTAWYALHHLGRIRQGDIALIHAATGGVGLAAVQVAQLAGAKVLATAGSPWKRDFLRSMGISDVMDSRTVAFADEVRGITGGRGVDLVLNSLAGEAIPSGIACLAPGGRFLEIGKRDIYQNAKVGLRSFRQNISFFVIDLARLIHDEPALVSDLLAQILSKFKEGKLNPLPVRAFGACRVGQAFRHMSQAKHIGKIVVSMAPEGVSSVGPEDGKASPLREDATYLITGGLGGFGLALAGWMVERGARHLVLVGRGGASTEDARCAVGALRERGCDVVVMKGDVCRPEDVDRVFRTIREQMPPMRGIVHAAMVMDDCTIERQTMERFHGVMAPKTLGAWNLHAASGDLELDFFVLFSSFSSMVGNPGQCSYAAANCFLDALAYHRRARGLPGLVVNWGPLGEVGYIARHEDLQAALRTQGLAPMDPEEATAMLERLLQTDAVQAAAVKIDWRRIAGSMHGVANSRRYEEVRDASPEGDSLEGKPLGENILDLPEADRLAAVIEALKEQVAKVLRVPGAKLDIQRPLNSLGFDSLMSVELANRIEGRFQVALPPGKITAATNTAALAGELLGWMSRGSAQAQPLQPVAAVPSAPHDGAVAATSASVVTQSGPAALSSSAGMSAIGAEGLLAADMSTAATTRDKGRQGIWLKAQFRMEWLLLRAGIALLKGGDYPLACRRMRRLARWTRPILRFNWLWSLQNLRLIFGPNLTGPERRRLATLAFENHFISYLEGLRHRDVSFDVRGVEHLLEARAAGRGVILCGAHLGSWEPALTLGSRIGLPIAVVYRRARNPLSDRIFQKIRASYDVGWIVSSDIASAFEALKSGKILGLMTDLNVIKGGTVADFLGVPATCPSGPARLALFQGSPIVPAVAIRLANGGLEVHLERAIEPPANDGTEGQVRALTRRINAAFEPWILEYAEQYNWLHPRWRCRPDGDEMSLGASEESLMAQRTAPFLPVSDRVRSLL